MADQNNSNKPGLFEKGGKLYFLHSTIDAFDTFLRVPGTVTAKGAHVRDGIDLKRVMIMVVIALVPAALFGMWNTGAQTAATYGLDWGFWMCFWKGLLKVLPLYIVSYAVGLIIEFADAQIKGEEVNEGYLVTGFLIPLILPVDVPLWMVALAVAFAVIFGKCVFGGTGMNIWNPALLARAFLFFSYPSSMSGSSVWVHAPKGVDAVSAATPLAIAHDGGMAALDSAGYSFMDMFWGFIPGSVGETSVVAILLGAILLIWTGVASWKIMLSAVVGGLCIGWIGNVAGATELPCYYQLVMGGFLFGAVFMATDPVTSAQTDTGKWIYGFLVGALAVTVRLWNPGYMEGMMLAILFMNTMAPLIDHCVVSSATSRRWKRMRTA